MTNLSFKQYSELNVFRLREHVDGHSSHGQEGRAAQRLGRRARQVDEVLNGGRRAARYVY